jgi:hypothetical protein
LGILRQTKRSIIKGTFPEKKRTAISKVVTLASSATATEVQTKGVGIASTKS